MTRHFCTYFDQNYALRGLTLFRSMQNHCGDFVLHVLCCDAATFELINALKIENLRAHRLEEIETFEPRLANLKSTRSRAEFLWTLSPIWPLFLLQKHAEIELLTYLDADLFFFSSDAPIWKEFGAASILIIEHRFPTHRQSGLENGRFNVGMMSFRRDENGLKCLNWYRERCLEWCFDRHEDGKYGDQKYLDEFPSRFAGVHILQHQGANVAPWNWMNGNLRCDQKELSFDGVPVIFYHFHGLKLFSARLFDPCRAAKLYDEMPRSLAKCVHQPYLDAMKSTLEWAHARGTSIPLRYDSIKNYGARVFLSKVRRAKLFLAPSIR